MTHLLFTPLTLPCGQVLKNRLVKAATSDSLGDGTGHPTDAQRTLYRRWAEGGLAAAFVGEVQTSAHFAEKPGNLVLNKTSDLAQFKTLATAGQRHDAQLWLQIGHAGALAFPPISTPKGPSALSLPGLACGALRLAEIEALPEQMAQTAALAQEAGFGGIEIHAAHGFLLSQFLSPLFNQRDDSYGGSIDNRMRLLLACIEATRSAVGPYFPIAVKMNASDMLEGGFDEADALALVRALDNSSIDLIDISGGTYFPGAPSSSDKMSDAGAYFKSFAKKARDLTSKPLMLTGGIKTFEEAEAVISGGIADIVGMARAFILYPSLPNRWQKKQSLNVQFPRFDDVIEGGITAWYTQKLVALGKDDEAAMPDNLTEALTLYEARDAERTRIWLGHFG